MVRRGSGLYCISAGITWMYGRRKNAGRSYKNTQVIIKEWIECALEDRALIPEPHLFNDVTV